MTKTFPLLPNLTCPDLAGYKLPPVEPNRTPIAIEVEMLPYSNPNGLVPATNPDGTVKVVRWVYE